MSSAILTIDLAVLETFFGLILRISAIIMTAPVFGSDRLPATVKTGFIMAAAIALYPAYPHGISFMSRHPWELGIGIISEISIGVMIGFLSRLIFSGIQMAGQLAGFQIGYSIVNVMDPMGSGQVPVVAQLNYLFAVLIFLALDAHHWMIRVISESFRLIPLYSGALTPEIAKTLALQAGDIFSLALKVCAPVIMALLLMSVAMGLIVRMVSQMNIFFVALPAKILLGLLFFVFSLPFLAAFLEQIFEGLIRDMMLLLNILAV